MDTVKFHVDRKVTLWIRDYFETTPDQMERVKQSVIEDKYDPYPDDNSLPYYSDDDIPAYCIQHQLETVEDMTISENGGFGTVEMFNEDGDEVCSNHKE